MRIAVGEDDDNPYEGQGGTPISAAVTGTVWELKAAAGQAVKAGDTLIVLEAMKMEYAGACRCGAVWCEGPARLHHCWLCCCDLAGVGVGLSIGLKGGCHCRRPAPSFHPLPALTPPTRGCMHMLQC